MSLLGSGWKMQEIDSLDFIYYMKLRRAENKRLEDEAKAAIRRG